MGPKFKTLGFPFASKRQFLNLPNDLCIQNINLRDHEK